MGELLRKTIDVVTSRELWDSTKTLSELEAAFTQSLSLHKNWLRQQDKHPEMVLMHAAFSYLLIVGNKVETNTASRFSERSHHAILQHLRIYERNIAGLNVQFQPPPSMVHSYRFVCSRIFCKDWRSVPNYLLLANYSSQVGIGMERLRHEKSIHEVTRPRQGFMYIAQMIKGIDSEDINDFFRFKSVPAHYRAMADVMQPILEQWQRTYGNAQNSSQISRYG